jgi:branched-chain amino acid transport system substrate-binding protein
MRPGPSLRPSQTRRDLCRQLLFASTLPLLGGTLGGCASFRAPAGGRDAALLLPLTGDSAALGQAMSRAASLVVVSGPGAGAPPVYDTEGSAEGAQRAARKALDAGAQVLFGPLRADQTPAVLAEAGTAPVVTFSNDDRLAAQGAFVMGMTPAQSVATVFSYARAQGVRRVAVVARPGPLGEATAIAARDLAAAGGLTLTAVLLRDDAAGLASDLRAAGGGVAPEAVLLPDGGAAMVAFAESLAGAGPRLMGSVQWGVLDVAGIAALEGAWFAAPPPEAFVPFLDTFEARFGDSAGVVTALAHDAALAAAALGDARAMNRGGLIRPAGFSGALGKYRFLDDGRCQRDLVVLTIEKGRIVTIGEVTGT